MWTHTRVTWFECTFFLCYISFYCHIHLDQERKFIVLLVLDLQGEIGPLFLLTVECGVIFYVSLFLLCCSEHFLVQVVSLFVYSFSYCKPEWKTRQSSSFQNVECVYFVSYNPNFKVECISFRNMNFKVLGWWVWFPGEYMTEVAELAITLGISVVSLRFIYTCLLFIFYCSNVDKVFS